MYVLKYWQTFYFTDVLVLQCQTSHPHWRPNHLYRCTKIAPDELTLAKDELYKIRLKQRMNEW